MHIIILIIVLKFIKLYNYLFYLKIKKIHFFIYKISINLNNKFIKILLLCKLKLSFSF